MIDREHKLPVTVQCQLLQLPRPSTYFRNDPVSSADPALMHQLDELHMEYPFASSRMLRDILRQTGYQMRRRHVRALMSKMGIEALYRKPNTSRRNVRAGIVPYLLRDLAITQPNYVWAADITYIPMKRGFIYLFALLD